MKAKVSLTKSNYTLDFGNHKFYFSSKDNKFKFQKKLLKFIETNEEKIINKFKVDLNISLYLAVSLYKKIEKQGFFITSKDGSVVNENAVFLTAIINYWGDK